MQASEAGPREGGRALGTRMGQGGQGDRLASADATTRFQGVAKKMGGGKDILVVGAKPPYEPMDYERLPESSEAFVYAAVSRLMVRRLARA